MQNERRTVLFSPPLAPIEVTADVPVVIGRQAQCDISLAYGDVSRQHAEVCCEGGKTMLRDLGSTNGTFLNGKEIDSPTALSPGDRIELGGRTVTFCELQPQDLGSPLALDADRTMIAEHTPTSETFVGDLSQIPPCAVLQVLEMGRKSGVLEIESDDLVSKLWFQHGVPVHAESSRQSGFDAALGMVNLERGRFHFEPSASTVEATLACTVNELLMEGCRLLDEQRA